MHKHTISHNTGQYPLYIGEHLLSNTTLLEPLMCGTKVFIITDKTIAPHYLDLLINALPNKQCDHLILPLGEAQKSLSTFEHITNTLISKHHHRDTTLIALGGGVIGDITGFVSACYLRGVNYIQIPTTLLAQADSSVGGKTAINHPAGKNLIGAFYQPHAVIADINTIKTLPERQYYSGLAEIIKAALIHDANFFNWLEKHITKILARNTATLIQAISHACEIKAYFVQADEKDQNLRQHLNLGHTFGHAIENITGYGNMLHGEAVAVGIAMAASLSRQLLSLSHKDYQRIIHLLKNAHLLQKPLTNIKLEDLTLAMQSDKKIKHQRISYILLEQIGRSTIIDQVTAQDIKSAWHDANKQITMEGLYAGSTNT